MKEQDTSGWITLQEVVASIILLDLGEDYINQEERILNMVIDEYRKLHLTHINSIKTDILEINMNGTFDLPNDFMGLSKIGVLNNGYIFELFENNNIVKVTNLNCGIEEDINNIPIIEEMSISDIWNNNMLNNVTYNDSYYYHPYASGSEKVIGQYRINFRERRIELNSSSYLNYLAIEYLSSGISLTSTTYIPVYVLSSLTACVLYRISLSDLTKSNLIQIRKIEKREALKELFNISHPINYKKLITLIRSTQNQGVKR